MRGLGALGALGAGGAVAGAAWLAHAGVPAEAMRSGAIAVAMLFGHSVAVVLLALARGEGRDGMLFTAAAALLAIGSIVFAGSVLARVLFGASSAAAPAGGIAMMVGWVTLALAILGARR